MLSRRIRSRSFRGRPGLRCKAAQIPNSSTDDGSEVHCARVGGLGAKDFVINTSAPPSRVHAECCQRAAIVRRTFERLLACGEGPTVLHLSPRRRGVLESDFEAWLRSRRRPAPGDAASSAEARCPMGLQNETPPVRSTSERPPQGTAPGKRGRPAGAKPISATLDRVEAAEAKREAV